MDALRVSRTGGVKGRFFVLGPEKVIGFRSGRNGMNDSGMNLNE